MTTVAIGSAGFMGAGLGATLRQGGARVVTTLAGRSPRTGRLAEQAGLEILPSLAAVVAAADVVLSVTPPGEAVAVAQAVGAAAVAAGTAPIVADLNAVSPDTMARVAVALGGLRTVDGAISGPPPSVRPGARIYLSGPDAGAVADLPWDGRVEPIVLRDGSASALKMCTGSVYKGLTALITQAMRTAGFHGVLDEVVADLERNGLAQTAGVSRSAPKAWRFVDEMREVAATQAQAGLTPDLFLAMAAVYADIARTRLAQGDPETASDLTAAEIVAQLSK
jgi:3-hydroxyisobutyrate dehydrogenase-like beta-hydroxyacid dehydrogenase